MSNIINNIGKYYKIQKTCKLPENSSVYQHATIGVDQYIFVEFNN